MPYCEPPYLIEAVVLMCGLPLVLAYRLKGSASVGPGETLAILLCVWAIASAAHTFSARRRYARRS